jgi:secreted Zn-dependent insulinase-like peptidase
MLYRYIIKEDVLKYETSHKEDNLDLGMQIALNMHYYKVPQLYCAKKLILKHDAMKIYTILEFIAFDKANIIYGTNDKRISIGEKRLTEVYYKRPYYVLSKSFITKPAKIFEPDMSIIFNMDLLKIKPIHINDLDSYNIPMKISPTMWYGGTSRSHEPHVIGEIFINNKTFYDNILTSLVSNIAINTINHYIRLIFFQEFNLGYFIHLSNISLNGTITLVINGPNYNYIDIFNDILMKISKIVPDERIISIIIDQARENLLNVSKMSPWSFINMIINQIMYKYVYNYLTKLEILKYITIDMVRERIRQLINIYHKTKNTDIITTIYGNIKEKELSKCIMQLSRDLYIVPLIRDRSISDYTIKHPNDDEKNKCIQFIFKCNESNECIFDPILTAHVLVLNNMLERPVFDVLRTKKQLGYLVRSGIIIDRNYYVYIKVQSGQDLDKVEAIMNEFVISFKEELDNFKEEEFMSIIKSTYDLLMQKYTNMNEMAGDYIKEIYNREFIFNRKKIIAKEVKKTLLNDIKKLYHSIIKNKTVIKII